MSPTNAAEAPAAEKGKVSSLTLAANHDGTFYDHKEPDELDLQLKRHRNDLQQIDNSDRQARRVDRRRPEADRRVPRRARGQVPLPAAA